MISIDVLGFLLVVHSGKKVNHAADRETCVVDHFKGKYQRYWRMDVNAEGSGRYNDHLKVFSPQFEIYKLCCEIDFFLKTRFSECKINLLGNIKPPIKMHVLFQNLISKRVLRTCYRKYNHSCSEFNPSTKSFVYMSKNSFRTRQHVARLCLRSPQRLNRR